MKKTSRKSLIKPLFILVVFFCICIWYYMLILVPIIKTYCTAKINSLTEQALNVAVSNVLNSSINYDNIMTINYAPSGEINFISANQYMINTITREIIKDANERIKSIDEDYVNIPIGTLTGIAIFNGRGVRVKLSASPVAIVGSSFDSNFISVGINNTLHKIYLNVIARIELNLPVKRQTINVSQQVLLCESVIVGKVPNVYLNNGQSDKILNLIPN
ncbi:MAG: sporulation protein YunB [Clostridia bacterium]|nr:sporulation protein YunB [Clostridia bacterium]